MRSKTRRTLLIIVFLGSVLLVGGYAGYRGYQSIRQARLVHQARDYLAKQDPRKASLVLQRALRYNPNDLEACRLMAQATEAKRSPTAMVYRSKVVELNPGSTEDRLALTKTAMTFRDFASASNTLEGVDAAGKNTAAYHNIAGAVAAASKQPAQAETHFLEAARLEPQNPVLQLNLSVVRLHGTNAQSLAEARHALKLISANPTNSALRCLALRELTVDSMRYQQADSALALSKQLLAESNSLFQDRILRLNVLRETTNAEYRAELATFQLEAATNAAKIYDLGMWQLVNTSASETLTWLRTTPMSEQTNLPAALLMADCFAALSDWRALESFLELQNWAELEFMRLAFKARALRGQNLIGAAKQEWELALKASNNQRGSLVMLQRLASTWRWQSEGEEILWTIVNRYPTEKWAFTALSQALFLGGRTRSLMTLYSREMKRSPSDSSIQNNLASIALLLEANELKPHDLAREVYKKVPTNSAFASTYAFSLHLLEKDAEALKIMQALKPQELQNPGIAGYYGLILKATGNKEKARAYLSHAFRAPMLPEEQKLFERAMSGI